jgi:hypothetical protein
MSQDQNAGQNNNIQTGNYAFKLWDGLNIWKQPLKKERERDSMSIQLVQTHTTLAVYFMSNI